MMGYLFILGLHILDQSSPGAKLYDLWISGSQEAIYAPTPRPKNTTERCWFLFDCVCFVNFRDNIFYGSMFGSLRNGVDYSSQGDGRFSRIALELQHSILQDLQVAFILFFPHDVRFEQRRSFAKTILSVEFFLFVDS